MGSNQQSKWREPPPPPPEGMSKNAWKRELRKQKFASLKDEINERRREKKKLLKAKRRELKETDPEAAAAQPKHRKPQNQTKLNMGIIIDCAFDDMMKDGERTSLSSQIVRCYADNKYAPQRTKLSITSLNKKLKERFDTVLKGHYVNWKDVTIQEDDYTPDPETMVYLSSDSSNVISELDLDKTYIIGGIVDKGRYKNLCNDKAKQQNLPTARLPIDEFVKISGRKVLTTNHVMEILLKWLELRDWKQAFESVLPPRKMKDEDGEDVKDGEGDGEDENDEDGEDADDRAPEGGDSGAGEDDVGEKQ